MRELIIKFEQETGLPSAWSLLDNVGYTKEFTEWLAEKLVKNLTIPEVSVTVCDDDSCAGCGGSTTLGYCDSGCDDWEQTEL